MVSSDKIARNTARVLWTAVIAFVSFTAVWTSGAQAHSRHLRPEVLPPAVTPAPKSTSYAITIDANPAHALNRFSPETAFGAGVDGVPFHAVPEIYTRSNIHKMLGAGFGAVSYRLYTELSVQDWHWNPQGHFSDNQQGYWISSDAPTRAIVDSYGYRLPRRGFTHDQGNDDDYSRLDDGALNTVWKSNPYLASAYTGDADEAHPQWVLYDLGKKSKINAAKIWWSDPYAVRYAVQYWTGDDPIYDPGHGAWVSFPEGAVSDGKGGTVTLSLGNAPKDARYLRIVMEKSSGTCAKVGGSDPRDCLGYAIKETGFGTLDGGHFKDAVEHRPDRKQTVTYASSVDPWHSASDRVHDQEQPGLDVVFQSGVTRGIPATVPIPMLYSTPDNAAAEIRYLEAQHYPIARVEMGEEPDGQYVAPEDYAALYLQFASAVHTADSTLPLGGPVFEDNRHDVKAWADGKHGETSWTKRFLAYLAAHDRSNDFNFFSFEHYPFAACGHRAEEANLLRETQLVSDIVSTWRGDGLPAGFPIFITETNYSQNETDAAQEVTGALWYAEMMGSLLATGANGAFFYEYEPIPLSPAYPCQGWGSYGVLEGNGKYHAQAPLSQYFAAQMLTRHWSVPGSGTNVLYPVLSDDDASWVAAYPLARPDGRWSVLLINRDFHNAHAVTLRFNTPSGPAWFSGEVKQTQFGREQYSWVEQGKHSYPDPDGPLAKSTVSGGADTEYMLPQESITTLTGTLSAR